MRGAKLGQSWDRTIGRGPSEDQTPIAECRRRALRIEMMVVMINKR